MTWQDLEDKIERWIKASNVALKILFPANEDSVTRTTIQLLNFADAVVIGSRSPKQLFRILGVFETLHDPIFEFQSWFSDQYNVSLRDEAITIWKRLGEAIRGIILLFISISANGLDYGVIRERFRSKDSGMDLIIHLDNDELIYPAGTQEYSLRQLLSDVPGNVDLVIFPNYESSVERDD
ncbi:hypothetical protein RJT34_12059 [Clitoria ternatea]|uniref:Exocyst complex subunit Exo70 C-terminal domain-containing protein n=1 Tax=Clitoria ternatea TaxID=43366 RepID=A0AAN9JNR4_CLITE